MKGKILNNEGCSTIVSIGEKVEVLNPKSVGGYKCRTDQGNEFFIQHQFVDLVPSSLNIEDMISFLEEQQTKLSEQIKAVKNEFEKAKIPVKMKGRKREIVNSMYYYLTTPGMVSCSCDNSDKIDDFLFNSHNYFLTKPEAERALELQTIENELCSLIEKINQEPECPESFPDWKELYQEKNSLFFDSRKGILNTSESSGKFTKTKFYCYRAFESEAIDLIGEDRLKMYLKEC